MPSMHVGSSVLLAIVAFAAGNRWLGRCLSVFAAIIFIGSIHLAWHYAVDSYLAWAMMLLIWWTVGPLARWWEGTSLARNFTATEPAELDSAA